jgi:hypothetical protein
MSGPKAARGTASAWRLQPLIGFGALGMASGVLVHFLTEGGGTYQVTLAVVFVAVAGVFLGRLAGGEEAAALKNISERRAAIERRIVEKPQDFLATVQLGLAQLDEYYVINKKQARNSFSSSMFAIVVGLATLVGGIWVFYLQPQPNLKLASISTISGVLVQFVGAGYFYLYRRSLDQLNFFFGQLVRMQDMMLSVRLCDELKPAARRAAALEQIIQVLLRSGPPTQPRPTEVAPSRPRKKSTDSKPKIEAVADIRDSARDLNPRAR